MKTGILFLICFGFLQAGEALSADPEKTVISLPELSGLNLKIKDLSNVYQLKKGKSGYENHVKIAVDMVYYEAFEERQSIYSALSLYNDANQAACGFEAAKRGLAQERDGNILENAPSFGQQSVLFVERYVDPKTGDFDRYHVLFYFGNIAVEIRVEAPEAVVPQKDVVGYAKIVEKNLKDDCPKCLQAESCSQ
ncbi:MAG: hypothetical protein Q8P84_09180 [Deltaproteobacteria bacterium]|nr:hypothetical protein [Deltaproteobacteria bacterium]